MLVYIIALKTIKRLLLKFYNKNLMIQFIMISSSDLFLMIYLQIFYNSKTSPHEQIFPTYTNSVFIFKLLHTAFF
uniref:Uncharacterized protein n=1 Tax=Pararge aegeria TaxID=116150 RepID=S4PSB8_9NEOP